MTLTIVAGANGSGKTTFAMSYSSMCGVVFVNADEIAKNLNPLDMESQKFHAGRIF